MQGMGAAEAMQSVELPAGTIRYRDSGSGPVLLFVHGLVVNGLIWRKVTPLLTDSYRCIVPDWPLGSHSVPMNPGADLTIRGVARLIADFTEALDLHDVTLVGNDTGGALCQMVAAWHRDRVARMVLTPCDAFEADLPAAFQYLKVIPRVPGALWVLVKSMGLPLTRRLPIAYGWLGTIPDDISDAYTRPARTDPGIRRDAAAVLTSLSKEHTLAAAAALRDFDRPVLLAWPRRCHFFPFSLAERLAAVLPDARIETVENSQGFVPEDQPERLAELIRQFVPRAEA